MSDREIGVEKARAQLGPLVNDAAIEGTITYLTLHGQRYAAIVPLNRIAVSAEEKTEALTVLAPSARNVPSDEE